MHLGNERDLEVFKRFLGVLKDSLSDIFNCELASLLGVGCHVDLVEQVIDFGLLSPGDF